MSAVSERPAVVAPAGSAITTPRRLVEVVVVAGLSCAFLMAPLLGWIDLHRTLTTARLSRTAATEVGARDAGLDPTVFNRLEEIIPPQASYWIDTSRAIRPSITRQAFPVWASGALLPRIAVAEPTKADWVVIWGYSPRRLPVDVVGLRILAVRTAPRVPVYVARVAR